MKTKLFNILKGLGTTQRDFAKISNISERRINDYCTGAEMPRAKAIVIMECLNEIKEEKAKSLKIKVKLEDLGHLTIKKEGGENEIKQINT